MAERWSVVWRDGICDNCGQPESTPGHHAEGPVPEDHPAEPWAVICPYARRPEARGYVKAIEFPGQPATHLPGARQEAPRA